MRDLTLDLLKSPMLKIETGLSEVIILSNFLSPWYTKFLLLRSSVLPSFLPYLLPSLFPFCLLLLFLFTK